LALERNRSLRPLIFSISLGLSYLVCGIVLYCHCLTRYFSASPRELSGFLFLTRYFSASPRELSGFLFSFSVFLRVSAWAIRLSLSYSVFLRVSAWGIFLILALLGISPRLRVRYLSDSGLTRYFSASPRELSGFLFLSRYFSASPRELSGFLFLTRYFSASPREL